MHRIVVALLLFALASSGCGGTYVGLSSDQYVPRVAETMRGYAGTHVYLQNFQNWADDTTLFHYGSPSKRVYYGGPLLTSYLWYSFQKALMRLGIYVYDQPRTTPVPAMQLTFLSWSDTRFVCDVQLLIPGNPPLTKRYRLGFPDPGEDPDFMQRHAYWQVDQIVTRIFGDPEFFAAFWRGQPGQTPQPLVSPSPPPPSQ